MMESLQLTAGTLVANRFEVDRLAGSGGMGSVYRARDRYSGDFIALKLLHPGLAGLSDGERFTREAQVLAQLHHPGIVCYVAHGQAADGQLFLAMQWLEGEDLAQRLQRQGPLPLGECLRLLSRVAAALAAAHQQGIIHRDRTHKAKIWLPRGYTRPIQDANREPSLAQVETQPILLREIGRARVEVQLIVVHVSLII